jgi:ribosomal protein S18 acetylase RimI-like enzyme
MMAVRRARAGVAGSAVAAWQAANLNSTVPEHADRLRARAGDPDALLLVAESGGRVIGMVPVLRGRVQDVAGDLAPGLVHLTGIAVSPESQRVGVGSALLDAALREAAETVRDACHLVGGRG